MDFFKKKIKPDPQKDEEDPSFDRKPSFTIGNSCFEHGVTLTALWVGYQRILEERQEKPLFRDPLAKILMDENDARQAYERMAETVNHSMCMRRQPYLDLEQNFIAIRHRFLDDFIVNKCGEFTRLNNPPEVVQVVDLASGFDSRAFRLPFPGRTNFYELDRPEVLDYKQKRLAQCPTLKPTCSTWICVPVDLVADQWEEKLIEKGFDPSMPSIWIMEGLCMYIPYQDLRQLLQRIRALSCPGSAFAGDFLNHGFKNNPLLRARVIRLREDGSPFVNFIDYPVRLLQGCGFTRAKYHFMGDPLASYDRVGTCPFLRAMVVTIRVVTNLIGALAVAVLTLLLPWYILLPIVLVVSTVQELIAIYGGTVEW